MRWPPSKNAPFGRNTGYDMLKIALVFLLLIVGVSMLGSTVLKFLRVPKAPPTLSGTRAKCGHCGRPVVGTAPCVCGKG